MIINKKNLEIIRTISLHDSSMQAFHFNTKICFLAMEYLDNENNKGIIQFKNVFELCFSSIKSINGINGQLWGWEEIPNEYRKDDFLEQAKKEVLLRDIPFNKWNDELFAVRFLMSDLREIKIICEEIHFNKNDDNKKVCELK